MLKSLSEHFGLSILLTEPDKNLLYVPNDALLFQELILPDIGKEYIEDFRVIFVGGKPVDYYTRKAKDPIVTKEGILVSNQIKLSQVLSNMLFSGEGYSEVPDNVHTYLDMAQVSWDILLSERLPYGHGQTNQEIYSLLCGEPLIGSVDMLVGKVPKVIESHAMMQFDAVNLITPICEYLETISENKRVVLYGHHVLYDSLAGELLNNGFEVHFADRI